MLQIMHLTSHPVCVAHLPQMCWSGQYWTIHHKQHCIVGTPVKFLDCRWGWYCSHGVANDQHIHPGSCMLSIYQVWVCSFAENGPGCTLETWTLWNHSASKWGPHLETEWKASTLPSDMECSCEYKLCAWMQNSRTPNRSHLATSALCVGAWCESRSWWHQCRAQSCHSANVHQHHKIIAVDHRQQNAPEKLSSWRHHCCYGCAWSQHCNILQTLWNLFWTPMQIWCWLPLDDEHARNEKNDQPMG